MKKTKNTRSDCWTYFNRMLLWTKKTNEIRRMENVRMGRHKQTKFEKHIDFMTKLAGICTMLLICVAFYVMYNQTHDEENFKLFLNNLETKRVTYFFNVFFFFFISFAGLIFCLPRNPNTVSKKKHVYCFGFVIPLKIFFFPNF
jgi:hypothetical protein